MPKNTVPFKVEWRSAYLDPISFKPYGPTFVLPEKTYVTLNVPANLLAVTKKGKTIEHHLTEEGFSWVNQKLAQLVTEAHAYRIRK